MKRTNEELKDELLRVYRYTFSTVIQLDRLKRVNLRLRHEAEEAKELQADAEKQLEKSNDDYRRNETVHQLVTQLVTQLRTGSRMCFCSMKHEGSCQTPRVEDEPIPPPSVDVRIDGAPMRCMSCNGYKDAGMGYLCEECWELDIDHKYDLLDRCIFAWKSGERDFPRVGWNAKILALTAK